MNVRLYQQVKNIYHFLQAHFWRVVYGRPDTAIHIYGVTGTNGKTTTSYILASILAAAHGREKAGMLTTVAFRVGEKEIMNETKLTTLPSRLVYRYVQEMKNAGVTHAVLELTSHALDQHRVAGIRLDGAIILNISPEHLNYHGTMQALTEAKLKIIQYLKTDVPLVYKQDNDLIRTAVEKKLLTSKQAIPFTAKQAANIQTRLEGDVNKENVLAARLLMEAAGVPSDAIDRGVMAIDRVPGRMEWVDRVLIDYAVTPDALERLYSYVRQQTSGRIFALLGAAGLRDREKRPKMAAAVARYADVLVITREDPWTEDEEQIFKDLESGLDEASKMQWRRIPDRREALKWLLEQAEPDDVVVVTGKGAETGMGIGKEIVPWNDKQAILEIMREK